MADDQRTLWDMGRQAPEHPDHWRWFAEFCKYERLTGGPDPHMATVVALCKGCEAAERAWRAALYVGFYNVPSAAATWRAWPYGRYLMEAQAMPEWLDAHWQGLRFRRERRTVKSPSRMAAYLRGVPTTVDALPTLRDADFETVWGFAMGLPHIGRYSAMKLTEIWHRLGLITATMKDIRAKGGWSPREGMKLLYGHALNDQRDDSPAAVEQAEGFALNAWHRLNMDYKLGLNHLLFEVLICDYKQCYTTQRQYPGRSLDSEIAYHDQISEYWGWDDREPHMRIRRDLFPGWALGEIVGWRGPRNELGKVLARYGYMWSDLLYDYTATDNLADPMKVAG